MPAHINNKELWGVLASKSSKFSKLLTKECEVVKKVYFWEEVSQKSVHKKDEFKDLCFLDL